MKAVMLMFDSLNRNKLAPYGCDYTITPNFARLAKHSITFDNCYAGSLPCIPARRELHTARYNFLHKGWGPLENYDDSMVDILKKNGIYTHLASDHGHYWEEGGCTYHTKYNSWEFLRGQEGDPWKGEVKNPAKVEVTAEFTDLYRKNLFRQDQINRKYMEEEQSHPLVKTINAGLEFIQINGSEDNWFLQIECFDPHEPFFSYKKYKDLYETDYFGPLFDWVDYKPVTESKEEIEHLRKEYFALLTMCDVYLGKVLDVFDSLDLWQDTMLIVNTDHGYLLSEHGYWAKNYMPQYNEIANIPLFIWDPRSKVMNEHRNSLVQTIDLPVTLLEFFGISPTKDMQGKDLKTVMVNDAKIREGGLFGVHGSHICCTDGRYVYMKAAVSPENEPLYNYTLVPNGFFMFRPEVCRSMKIAEPYSFTKDCKLMRFDVPQFGEGSYKYGDLLYDLENDPNQLSPINDDKIIFKMKKLMITLMEENDCPKEQYIRVGLK